jgi:hypothetical protein
MSQELGFLYMTLEKKSAGTRHKTREEKKRKRPMSMAVSVAILTAAIIISGFTINSMLKQPSASQTVSYTSQPRAAIVDQLSLTLPNQSFIETATNTLKQAGYSVDYYPGENVTVDFYRNLPTHGYSLIILRVHSTTGGYPSLCLFTCEHYSQFNYVSEQLSDEIVAVSYSPEEAQKGEIYVGISYHFVESCMQGRFSNSAIVMMGCESLNNTYMAKAFLQKGAEVYMGWNTLVSASHTDTTTNHLLQHFLIQKETVKQALLDTLIEVGLDPTYPSLLLYYPPEAGEQTKENIGSKN